ncbi:unnamed protein product [Agarophyton chilense]
MSKTTKAFVPYLPFSQHSTSPLVLSARPGTLPSWRRRRACVMHLEEPYEEKRGFEKTSSHSAQSPPVYEEEHVLDFGKGEFDVDENEDYFDDEGLDIVDIPPEGVTLRRKRVRKNVSRLLDEISTEPVSDFTNDADDMPPVEDDESAGIVRTAVRAIDQRKGENIVAFRVAKLTHITSFIVIASANNTPQMRAIANLVEDDLFKHHGMSSRRKDGVPESGWILLDYGDFMVNIFSAAQRRNYNLEALWKKGELLDVSDCIMTKPDEKPAKTSDAALDDWLNQ